MERTRQLSFGLPHQLHPSHPSHPKRITRFRHPSSTRQRQSPGPTRTRSSNTTTTMPKRPGRDPKRAAATGTLPPVVIHRRTRATHPTPRGRGSSSPIDSETSSTFGECPWRSSNGCPFSGCLVSDTTSSCTEPPFPTDSFCRASIFCPSSLQRVSSRPVCGCVSSSLWTARRKTFDTDSISGTTTELLRLLDAWEWFSSLPAFGPSES
mmetsp:Transcript_8584/g.25449  ORF Transcript_8584/g.25449 Transcript_8584/m.25449 type:complete len:209 (-) Transcript_8584:237-863(-)